MERIPPSNPDAWPIQIRNGVIGIDFGKGCLGCTWCITKRQPGRIDSQDRSYKNHLTADQVYSYLQKTKAFTDAGLPLRIGNNTDGTLIPVSELKRLYGLIPSDYPIALLTRGIHSKELNEFLDNVGPNFMLLRTVTVPHESLDYKLNFEMALNSFKDANCQKVLNIGPIAQETYHEVAQFIEKKQLPEGTRIIFAPLNLRLLPHEVTSKVSAKPINGTQIYELEELAIKNGYITHRANNCAIAEMQKLPSIEYGDINHGEVYTSVRSNTRGTSNSRGVESQCKLCPNHETCSNKFTDSNFSELSNKLEFEAKAIGIQNVKILSIKPGIILINAEGITKSETSYLSGIMGVRISAVESLAQPDAKAVDRWKENYFYPVDEIIEISQLFDPLQSKMI